MTVTIFKILKEINILRKHNKSGDQYRVSKSIDKIEKLLKILQSEIKN